MGRIWTPMKKSTRKFEEISCGSETSKKFPAQLIREDYFKSPIWFADDPSHVDELNRASDPWIKKAKQAIHDEMKKSKVKWPKGDFGSVYHSNSLIGQPAFRKLQDYIGITTANLLLEQGFDLTNHQIFITEMWVQEFSSKGGGHHTLHTHWNGHMSGFYFLKASQKTSRPMFQDPRPGAMMNLLPEKDVSKISYASLQVNYEAIPGRLMFFPSYLPHMYVVDSGEEPFRFIHFNCQAIPIGVLNAHKNKK